jgi:hypothetical protein
MLSGCRKSLSSIRGAKNLRLFSSLDSSTSTDSDDSGRVKNVIDPYKGQYTDFLKNVSVWEESNDDTLKSMVFLNMGKKLAGYCTEGGTDKYYRMS